MPGHLVAESLDLERSEHRAQRDTACQSTRHAFWQRKNHIRLGCCERRWCKVGNRESNSPFLPQSREGPIDRRLLPRKDVYDDMRILQVLSERDAPRTKRMI